MKDKADPQPTRFEELLDYLNKMGLSQNGIARRAAVPRQYLSDVKTGRRQLTELFARRLADEFDVDHVWLMTGQGHMNRPRLEPRTSQGADAGVLLPLLTEPATGIPRDMPAWDGGLISLSGPAAAIASRSNQPYVLRIGHDDHAGRLVRNDLVLISQSVDSHCEINVVASRKRLVLARRTKGRKWRSIATGDVLPARAEAQGSCRGIVWGAI